MIQSQFTPALPFLALLFQIAQAAPPDSPRLTIDSWGNFVCVLTEKNTLSCGGIQRKGDVPLTGSPPGTFSRFVSAPQICAIAAGGVLSCFESGSMPGQPTVFQTTLPDGTVSVALSNYELCAVTESGQTWCRTAPELGEESPPAFERVPDKLLGFIPGYATSDGDARLCLGDKSQLSCRTSWLRPEKKDHEPAATRNGWPMSPEVVIGESHLCLLAPDGRAACQGEAHQGELGSFATKTDDFVPVKDLRNATRLVGTQATTCARTESGEVLCWGGEAGALTGTSTNHGVWTPLKVPWADSVQDIAMSHNHFCILTKDSRVRCRPLRISPRSRTQEFLHAAPRDIVDFSVSQNGSLACYVKKSGEVSCAGSNWAGQVGDGRRLLHSSTESVLGVRNAIRVWASSDISACAQTLSNDLVCWGKANPHWPVSSNAITIGNPGERIVSVVADHESLFFCALSEHGKVSCWGKPQGRYGAPACPDDTCTRLTPMHTGPHRFIAILAAEGKKDSLATHGLCAITSHGAIRCFGSKAPLRFTRLGTPSRLTGAAGTMAFLCLNAGSILCGQPNPETGALEKEKKLDVPADGTLLAADWTFVIVARQGGKIGAWTTTMQPKVHTLAKGTRLVRVSGARIFGFGGAGLEELSPR